MFDVFLRHVRTYADAWIIGTTVVFCTLVATVLTYLNGNVWLNYVASYSIGMTCMSMQLWVHKRRPESWSRESLTAVTAIVSLILGLLLGGTLGAFDPIYFFRANVTGLVIGGTACIVAAFVILLMGYIRDLEAERDAARQQELVKERELAIAQLRTLQAQIEPHFLFNTLANVQSLIESSPGRASEVLDALAQLFRTSLTYARSPTGSVRQEVELISSYLDIQRTRLGDRLTYDVEVEEGVNEHALPPFLVQPLVENAIKHGIESSTDPGHICVHLGKSTNTLRIAVSNTGKAFDAKSESDRVGLTNVRERLASVYGSNAELKVERTSKNETRVMIVLPLETIET